MVAEQLPAVGPELAHGIDMAIERLAGDPQFGAQLAHFRLRLPHRRHGQAQLGGCHLIGPAAVPPPGAGGGHARLGPLDDQLPLELGQGGEDAENQLAAGGCSVDARPVAAQDLETDAAISQVVHGVDEVPQVAAQPVELPDDQRVALAQRLQAGRQSGPVISLSGRGVFVEVPGIDAGGQQGISLEVGHLAAVRLAYPHVTNQHASPH